MHKIFLALISLCYLSACENLEYKRPKLPPEPKEFLNAGINWKEAKPNADYDRGEWWKIFNDSTLNDLEDRLNKNNQNIIAAEHVYNSSFALVAQARAAYLPVIGGSSSFLRDKLPSQQSNGSTSYKHNKSHNIGFNASWEIDIFNQIKYSVNSNISKAKFNKSTWEAIKLSAQSSLAYYYFELRSIDLSQKYMNKIAKEQFHLLKYENLRYKAGIDNKINVINYQNNYNISLEKSKHSNIARNQIQHAIALLIGESPSTFKLDIDYNTKFSSITIPYMIPSQLIERRPDIAQAEFEVMQANAAIGVARSAFFPTLNLSANSSWGNPNHYGPLFSLPQFLWSVGPQLGFALFDGGARSAESKSIKSLYKSKVATYINSVLSAFKEVEDQLVKIKILEQQEKIIYQSLINRKIQLKLIRHQYKHGIIDANKVSEEEKIHYDEEIYFIYIQNLKRITEIALIKSLGGGWKETDD